MDTKNPSILRSCRSFRINRIATQFALHHPPACNRSCFLTMLSAINAHIALCIFLCRSSSYYVICPMSWDDVCYHYVLSHDNLYVSSSLAQMIQDRVWGFRFLQILVRIVHLLVPPWTYISFTLLRNHRMHSTFALRLQVHKY